MQNWRRMAPGMAKTGGVICPVQPERRLGLPWNALGVRRTIANDICLSAIKKDTQI